MWSHINLHRSSSTAALILSHWKEFHRLWKRFEEIAKIVIPKGVAMFVEWLRGCRYWANKRVARFLDRYGFPFADFDGCMYGLVATKGKEVGTPIKKPWRVAYVNSSLGTRLNAKCDGSHIHTPCSGQNTSITEGHTPAIVRIVHECFRDDVRNGIFDVPTYTSASVPMHGNPAHIAAVSRLNFAPTIRAQHRASLPMAANWTEIFDQLDELEKAESANAEVADMATNEEVGDGLPDFDADNDDNVEHGEDEIRAIWIGEEVIEQARFTPDIEAKFILLEVIESMEDDKALYEWLKKAIYLCEFIVPCTKFSYIKMGTITMIVRMLDPEQICGTNVADTVSLRQRCIQATIRFGNTAGELLCLWDTTGIDNKEWVPTT